MRMNNKLSLITILTMLVFTGCDDMFSKSSFEKYDYTMEPPEWVEDILSRNTNLDLLVGTWSYASILIYENTECIGENEIYDYTAIVTYGDTTASIQGTKIWTYEEELLEDEEYTQEEFISNCSVKDGEINSDGDCEFSFSDTFIYYLSEDGYCEVYEKDNEYYYYCGFIEFIDFNPQITFIWNYEEWDKSGCKVFQLISQD